MEQRGPRYRKLVGCKTCGVYRAVWMERCPAGCGDPTPASSSRAGACPPRNATGSRDDKGRALCDHYWDFFQEVPEPRGPEDVREACRRGNAVLVYAGHWRIACG